MSDRQREQHGIAETARKEMFNALLNELGEVLSASGPGGAIEVCSTRAPAIAAEIGERFGVRIGRTSWKLRNPNNTPPIWAELLVDERPGEPRLMADRSGRLGALTPIRLGSTCLRCHGSTEQVSPDVAAALERLYPEDRATGFARGDLRGWFWVEVP